LVTPTLRICISTNANKALYKVSDHLAGEVLTALYDRQTDRWTVSFHRKEGIYAIIKIFIVKLCFTQNGLKNKRPRGHIAHLSYIG
jgi:hypothetical protein